MNIHLILTLFVISHNENTMKQCDNTSLVIDSRYDVNLNRTELQKSMFSCQKDQMIFPEKLIDEYNRIYDKGLHYCQVFANYFNSIINGFYDVNGLKCKIVRISFTPTKYYLGFDNSYYCNKGIEQLNYMVFDRGNVIKCSESGTIIFNKYGYGSHTHYPCLTELNNKHYFERILRCASSEFGFPTLPFRGECICLPGSTGSHCQFSDKNTCNCNGKALDDGYCDCYDGYDGFYCEIDLTTKTTTIVSTITSNPTKTFSDKKLVNIVNIVKKILLLI